MTAERDAAQDAASPPARRGRRWLNGASRWALGVAGIVLVGLVVLWSERKPIANRYIGQLLADRGVAARYTIADLGFDRQRLTNVVIGDPARPDLVADWIEVATSVGLDGARVTGLRAGSVRMRGKIVDGRLILGEIDRLLPPSSGAPFTLPAIDLDIADGRMRLETPQGLVGIKLAGRGRLDNGFTGRAAIIADHLALQGCTVDRVAATWAVRVIDRQPSLTGPLRAGVLVCGSTRATGLAARLDATLDSRLDRWDGKARIAVARVVDPAARLEAIAGTIDFAGSAARTTGALDLHAGAFQTAPLAGAAIALMGRYVLGGDGSALHGQASASGAGVTPSWQARIAEAGTAGAGTPVAPLMVQLSRAAMAAARDMAVSGDVDLAMAGDRALQIGVAGVQAVSASGAQIGLSGGDGLQIDARGARINGMLTVAGGGLPEAVVQLSQAAVGTPITGSALIRPYAAGDARLALTAIDFTASSGGATRITTRVTLSGPIGTGRIDGGQLAVAADWDGRARWRINPGCSPIGFDRLAIAGLVLVKSRFNLCATGAALVQVDGTHIGGGGRIAGLRAAGRLGSAPVTLAADEARFGIAGRDFSVSRIVARLGSSDGVSALDIASVTGKLAGAGAVGSFTGGAGQIAKVPLLISGGAGDWRLDRGKLALSGGLIVADADANPRFFPLKANNLDFALENGRIAATAALAHPETGVHVADVTLAHDLDSGAGHADLSVPGIRFGEAFQPAKLTRFTYGVIADVQGMVSGNGQIRWTRDGVTSDGVFRTTNTDFAAAFGPVTGLSGEIRFTDLLNMASAPGQIATIANVNPGVPVLDGLVRYQTLPGARVAVEGARWPFAGGALVLEPSILDFSESQERRLTFRVEGVDAAQFLQQFDFKNLDATGTFDGVLPMIFDQQGGRIEGGHLTVRETGGTIAYVGELSQRDLGFWGNMAFQALKSLHYKSLAIEMNGPLAGEMITEVSFAGISQGAGTKSNFLIRRLQKLPLVFNIRIQAPFRQLIDSTQSFYDPQRLIERHLPELIRAQNESLRGQPITPPPAPPPAVPGPQTPTKADKSVQPPASEHLP
ncbi:YdbH domain-containing protein [Sphingomonas sp. 28-63-12]|uniref:intermembrane phospholipid transport protein YdbH family protein n=1 Tax=Sphingomonas sp. 28-63-12 TaxID=1970434 RepID=UPI0035A86EF8